MACGLEAIRFVPGGYYRTSTKFGWTTTRCGDRLSGRRSTGDVLMQIMAKCPGCGSVWRLDSSAADRRITCRKCGQLFKVPKPEDVPKAMKIIKQAKGTIYVDEAGKTYG